MIKGFGVAISLLFLFSGCESSHSQVTTTEHEPITTSERENIDISQEEAPALPAAHNQGEPINIVFAGDIMFEWSLEDTVQQHGADYPFAHVHETISEADYAIANLETAVTDHEVPYEKIYNFKTNIENLEGIANAGFDFVSLANNHTMDYGEEGLMDTIHALEGVSLDYAGAGRNKEDAYAPHTMEINGKIINIFAFSQVLPSMNWYAGEDKPGIASGYQEDRVVDLIREVDEESDYVLVYMHWGNEGEHMPETATRNYAEMMTEAGADAVVGAHPHVLQGFEFFDDQPVAYSIGNFLFPDYVEGPTAETGVLNIELANGEASMSFKPWLIDDDQIVDGGESYQKDIKRFLEEHSFNVAIDGFDIEPE
ncbi:CapA family protein [Texcoconibacillus texcoconensis]|uniref:Poly-gamma-glutamate synthesis protein (Capsule biosynthesis protein) n=1 Tax=Texcoconibacillus texcoconensis TaxID=1095777 RepID=A0A840QUT8_9BACI|nr:CapA family protein [Texcoconibacillus texcoconensis]MBB5175049.1 poly-gamma-glutamate synthesis protein (capsule biosynthesis protein) [Texcoconibacillus texcoconensis]